MIKILGLQYKKKYNSPEDMKTLRYGKLMIMTDQDQVRNLKSGKVRVLTGVFCRMVLTSRVCSSTSCTTTGPSCCGRISLRSSLPPSSRSHARTSPCRFTQFQSSMSGAETLSTTTCGTSSTTKVLFFPTIIQGGGSDINKSSLFNSARHFLPFLVYNQKF
jgi:hypothetical protein